jgi:hypothetical protein
MLLALAICEICPSSDVDVIISVLMNLYDTRTSLVNLLKAMIDREIAHTGLSALAFPSTDLIVYRRERRCLVPKQFHNYPIFVGFRESPWIQLPQKSDRPPHRNYVFDSTGARF